jgi:hypothetical protein
MQRLLILLLICFLPMQVFAGVPAASAETKASLAFSAHSEQQHELLVQCSIADDCGAPDTLVDDIEMHVDLGDETVPAFPFVFAAASLAGPPALSNDKACQPPFLPPAGPPPRA